MPIDILMPALSPTMETGNLAKWLVKEGDTVAAGDVIAEIETDKATMEVEAVDEGKMGRILVAEGATDVPVNQVIALLLAEGEDESALEGAEEKAEKETGTETATKEETPAAPRPQDEEGSSDSPRPEEGASAPVSKDEGAREPAGRKANGEGVAAAGPVPRTNGERVFVSPLARRLAKEHGLDLAALSGSGPHGRIVKRDIEAAVETGEARSAPAARPEAEKPAAAPPAPAAARAPSMTDEQIKGLYEPGSYEEKPHDGMRKTIARRLVAQQQEVPVFYLTVDIAVDALLELRRELNAAAPKGEDDKPAYRLSVNDFIIKAMARALIAVPMANATWTEGTRLFHKHADVGVAVAVPDGLFTPVIRRADEKTLSAISNEMKDLASRARSKKLKPEEYQGGVTAVSNLGMYAIKEFTAIINPPHASILAVGASEKRPVIRDDAVAIATMMSATLACDHRVIDGALGAELIGAFKGFVESPMRMLV